jgi:hypothetical protein
MYVRKNKSWNGTYTVQVAEKRKGKVRIISSFGTSSDPDVLAKLEAKARHFIEQHIGQLELFPATEDDQMRRLVSGLSSSQIRVIGPELILGRVFDFVGFNQVAEPLFRHLVLSRLVFPGSKLKTVDYLYPFQEKQYSVSSVYRYLDSLQEEAKSGLSSFPWRMSEECLVSHFRPFFTTSLRSISKHRKKMSLDG